MVELLSSAIQCYSYFILVSVILQAFRRVVAVNPLPSKSVKEELATKLGLTFSQVISSIVVIVPRAQQSENCFYMRGVL